MSTLGTFANFMARPTKKELAEKKAAMQAAKQPTGLQPVKQYAEGATNVPNKQYRLGETNVPSQQAANMPTKSNRRVAKGKKAPEGFGKLDKLKKLKTRNLIVGAGLGLAGLGTAGAIAYNNRNAKKQADMSGYSDIASFVSQDRKDAVKKMTQTGNADADAAIKMVRDETRKARRKELGKVAKQKGFESAADKGDAFKNAKGGEYIGRTLATAGSPERAVIAQGKKSQNSFIKGAANAAEKFGSAGYKEGATGLRKVGNAIAGRSVIGKAVRLGAAGVGLSAIGGAMKRKRQENQ